MAIWTFLNESHWQPNDFQRIVSLVPSQTELLSALELDENVIGITKFCVHPAGWRKKKTVVGGTKNVHIDRVLALRPTLVIANKEENQKDQIEAIANYIPVIVTQITTFQDAVTMISKLGALLGRSHQAQALVSAIVKAWQAVESTTFHTLTASYLIWNNPIMVAGGDTFISDIMHKAGFRNVFNHSNRYPEVSLDQFQALQPEVLLLASEPFPFAERHAQRFRQVLPHTLVQCVDGQMFSWYGSRLLYAAPYLLNLHIQLTGQSQR